MARAATNDVVSRLRSRHERERAAAGAVAQAAGAVESARQRRADALARLDADLAAAVGGHDVAVAVLASLLNDDGQTAEIAGVQEGAVRAIRRRVAAVEVRAAAAWLTARARPGHAAVRTRTVVTGEAGGASPVAGSTG
jgi:hypothetical protein